MTLFQLQRLLLQALNETVRLSRMLFTDSKQITVIPFEVQIRHSHDRENPQENSVKLTCNTSKIPTGTFPIQIQKFQRNKPTYIGYILIHVYVRSDRI